MTSNSIPEKSQVLIVGGGPGGSYAATVLTREGIDVLVLEAEKFPRYHVGESMLASMRHFLRFIDFEDGFENYGFTRKVGAAFKLNRQKREGYTDFIAQDPANFSWNVIRSEADDLLFKYASKCGALTFDETRVTDVIFKDDNPQSRPIGARWKNKNGETGEVKFDWLIDASGRAGLLSAKYLKTRKYNQSLKNIAMWAYWEGTNSYSPGTPREGSPYFEALSDESGWCWFIPLGKTTSVGIVMNQDISVRKREEAKKQSADFNLTSHYFDEIKLAPNIIGLIGEGKIANAPDGGTGVKFASDYSYSATEYAGENYRLIGDAAAFIDPYFSSGVHLAMANGLSAAATICASLKGECSEAEAAKWHSAKVGTSYTRFLLVVLSAYRQILAQDHPVLSDIDEDNFDRAFQLFRPIIQGMSDTKKLSSEELNKTIDFCTQGFQPTLPEEREAVLSKAEINEAGLIKKSATDQTDDDKRVIAAINARKVLRTDDINHINNIVTDVLEGRQMRFVRGSLGLQPA